MLLRETQSPNDTQILMEVILVYCIHRLKSWSEWCCRTRLGDLRMLAQSPQCRLIQPFRFLDILGICDSQDKYVLLLLHTMSHGTPSGLLTSFREQVWDQSRLDTCYASQLCNIAWRSAYAFNSQGVTSSILSLTSQLSHVARTWQPLRGHCLMQAMLRAGRKRGDMSASAEGVHARQYAQWHILDFLIFPCFVPKFCWSLSMRMEELHVSTMYKSTALSVCSLLSKCHIHGRSICVQLKQIPYADSTFDFRESECPPRGNRIYTGKVRMWTLIVVEEIWALCPFPILRMFWKNTTVHLYVCLKLWIIPQIALHGVLHMQEGSGKV